MATFRNWPRRLLSADQSSVTFAYKDYADGAKQKTMTLGTAEFVRRFALHVLPERFVKIRHYGLLGNRGRDERLARARELLGVPPPAERKDAVEAPDAASVDKPAPRCPYCQRTGLVALGEVPPGSPLTRLDSS
jgi:hypothetical protein